MDRRITVKIDPLGAPTIEAHGFAGQGCAEATSALERVLGGGGENTRELKPEWHQTEDEQQHQHHTW